LIRINVRESFEEYKKTIETLTINFKYLYDGDVKSSSNKSYSGSISHKNTSPSFVINCINQIYDESIQSMIDKSIPMSIGLKTEPLIGKPSNVADNIFYYIDKLKTNTFKPLYVFCSDNGRKLFGITKEINKNKPFPAHFYDIEKYHSRSYDLYLSPTLINDKEDDIEIYVTDKSIQSLVYSIQNMDYKISKDGESYKHTMSYDFYDCDFTCYKLIIKDVSKWRAEKINEILNEN